VSKESADSTGPKGIAQGIPARHSRVRKSRWAVGVRRHGGWLAAGRGRPVDLFVALPLELALPLEDLAVGGLSRQQLEPGVDRFVFSGEPHAEAANETVRARSSFSAIFPLTDLIVK